VRPHVQYQSAYIVLPGSPRKEWHSGGPSRNPREEICIFSGILVFLVVDSQVPLGALPESILVDEIVFFLSGRLMLAPRVPLVHRDFSFADATTEAYPPRTDPRVTDLSSCTYGVNDKTGTGKPGVINLRRTVGAKGISCLPVPSSDQCYSVVPNSVVQIALTKNFSSLGRRSYEGEQLPRVRRPVLARLDHYAVRRTLLK
jgi:hypothetical protein